MWLHVDGAYGLPAAAAPATRSLFAGLDRADSVVVDAHKWLYLPKACGVVLVRERAALERAFVHDEAYMLHGDDELNAVDRTLEYSRPFRALKLWLAFRVHGAAAFREAIADNVALARRLADTVRAHDELELVVPDPQLSTVPFRHAPPGVDDLDAHNLALVEALQHDSRVYVSSAVIDGRVVPAAVHRQLPHHGGGRRRAGRGDARARARAGRRYPDVLTASVMPSATGRTTVARSARATRAAFRSRSASMSPCAQPPPVR